MGIEPTSSAWKADILADVRCPHAQLQGVLYHTERKMSSTNLLNTEIVSLTGRFDNAKKAGGCRAKRMFTKALENSYRFACLLCGLFIVK